MATLNFIITNHGKTDLNINSIVSNTKKIKEDYGNLVSIFFISSKHTEKQRKAIESAEWIDSYFVDENLKKFEKIKYINDIGIIPKNEFVQIWDADDYIISPLLGQMITTLSVSECDIILNEVFKIDPIKYGNKINLAAWSGVSSNTIYRLSVLEKYFENNKYYEILSEDNVRHVYALLSTSKLQKVKIPYYIGIRWWEGVISNSSLANYNNQYSDSVKVIKELENLANKINKIKTKVIWKNRYITAMKNEIWLSWVNKEKDIESEIQKKLNAVIYEHHKIAKNENISKKEALNDIMPLMNKLSGKYVNLVNKSAVFQLSQTDPSIKKINYSSFQGKCRLLKFSFDTSNMEIKYLGENE